MMPWFYLTAALVYFSGKTKSRVGLLKETRVEHVSPITSIHYTVTRIYSTVRQSDKHLKLPACLFHTNHTAELSHTFLRLEVLGK